MKGRVLIVEPDVAGRSMMERVLVPEGLSVESVAGVHEAEPLLDAGRADLAIVDELAGRAPLLDDIRWLRREHPSVPVIATGALLSRRVLQELLRLDVADALAKPFTPTELREAVARALGRATARHDESIEFSAAVATARRAIASSELAAARPALVRAQAKAPLDAEVMGLWALCAELQGRDEEAGRGYRAALALREDEDTLPPDPHEGLARLRAYRGARPVATLGPERRGAALWLVTEPVDELDGPAPCGDEPHVVVTSLGISSRPESAVFFREGDGPRAFALLAGDLRAECVAAALGGLGSGRVCAAEPTRARVDLGRIERLRGEAGREGKAAEACRSMVPAAEPGVRHGG